MKHWNTTSEIVAQSAGEAEFDVIVNREQNCLGMRNSMRDLQSQVQIITKIVARVSKNDCFGDSSGKVGHIDVTQLESNSTENRV